MASVEFSTDPVKDKIAKKMRYKQGYEPAYDRQILGHNQVQTATHFAHLMVELLNKLQIKYPLISLA